MTKEEIKARLDEIEYHILKNPTADFQELTSIIFERIKELRGLLKEEEKQFYIYLKKKSYGQRDINDNY